jgi:hypothetical protein
LACCCGIQIDAAAFFTVVAIPLGTVAVGDDIAITLTTMRACGGVFAVAGGLVFNSVLAQGTSYIGGGHATHRKADASTRIASPKPAAIPRASRSAEA